MRRRAERPQRRLRERLLAPLDLLCEHFGDDAAREICVAAAASVDAIGAWAARAGDRHRLSPRRAPEGLDQRRPGRRAGTARSPPARGSGYAGECARARRRGRRGGGATRRSFAAALDAGRRDGAAGAAGARRCAPPLLDARGGDLRAHPRARDRARGPAAGSWSETDAGARRARRRRRARDQRRPPPRSVRCARGSR